MNELNANLIAEVSICTVVCVILIWSSIMTIAKRYAVREKAHKEELDRNKTLMLSLQLSNKNLNQYVYDLQCNIKDYKVLENQLRSTIDTLDEKAKFFQMKDFDDLK